MKPPAFDYQRAESLPHACELLAGAGDGAKILAGGQTLIAMLNFRLARPSMLIDVSNIPERNQVLDEGNFIRVRATSVQRFVERSPLVQQRLPLLRRAIEHIAHFQIRNKGTIGGSLCNADPASELPAMSLALDAEFEVIRTGGHRSVPAHEFFITSMTSVVQPDEVLSSIRFAVPPPRSGWGFHEVARRSGDYALVGAAAVVTLDAADRCIRARIALFGVASTPVRARAAEEILSGQRYSPDLLQAAARNLQSDIDPESDVHVTAEYRRDVAQTLTARVLEEAFKRAQESR